jgi:hypothetical protein
MANELPPELQAVFDLLERSGPHASIKETRRLMAAQVRDYNARPQAELGGLSPDVVSQLLHGDWMSEGALRLDETLAHEELAGAAILADARTLLEYVQSEGPIKETSAGNLPRAVVAALVPRLRMLNPRGGKLDLPPTAHLNEGDVHWLPDLRYVLIFAGLLMRRKGLRITAHGRALLSPDREGELYALLFRTLFNKLDLRNLDRSDRHVLLQGTVAYSFYQLRTAAREWSSSELLAERAWLDSARDPLSEWESIAGVDFRYFSFEHRVLDPLAQFGLLESRLIPGEQPHAEEIEYRCTPLFDRFLRFDFTSE